jgi:hypothetical protein
MAKVLKRLLLFGVLPLLLLGGAVVWCEREPLLSWYYLRQLERARGDEVARWAERTATLDARVVPSLLAMLARDDEVVSANAHAAIVCLGQRWGKTDPRAGELIQQAVKEFPRLAIHGQRLVLELAADWASSDTACPDALVSAGSRLLAEAHHLKRPVLCGPTVELALIVSARSNQADLVCAAREVARAALSSPEAATRVRALRLATHPGIDLHRDALPLLNDREPLVRRAAMLAVGEDAEIIPTESLMAFLHDPDEQVRRLCEEALRGPKRGSLKPASIRLARLITDSRWEVRLSVLDHLTDEDLGVWLRRLSEDVSPAVRAAAVRAACACVAIDLTDRLDQMAREDPSPSVAALARHYLRQRNR